MAAPRRKSLTLSEWIGVFERFVPQSVAFDWDSAGLQIGDPEKSIRRVAAALEATPETVAAAVKSRSDLLVIHHPLIWKPLKSLVCTDPVVRVAIQCIQNDLAVYAAHTSWDLCPLSMTRHLGRLLNLKHLQPLLPKPQPEGVKLVVFVPGTHLAQVRQAMAEAGAGTIGNYTECSFSVEGTGTFFGQQGASPALGEQVAWSRFASIGSKCSFLPTASGR
jgi:putative NIF3 family GTP cyclohydrolase 1 type 2